MPFFHCFGLVLATLASITHSTAMVPIDVFDAKKVMEAIHTERCTAVHGVPTMFIAMLEHPDFSKYDFTSLRTGIMAGSPCPIKVMRQVVDQMHMPEITIAYGMTESSPVSAQTTTDDPLELRVATVGRVHPHVEVKIVDIETGEPVGPGVEGEYCTRGYSVMKRATIKMPEATALAIDKDGWLHSGDVASVDENGYFRITGRIKDMIIRGGENIYPKEIEDFLYTNPKVKDVQVIGVPSRKYGEEVMAVIIPKEGVEVSEEEIRQFALERIARYKTPKYIKFRGRVPHERGGQDSQIQNARNLRRGNRGRKRLYKRFQFISIKTRGAPRVFLSRFFRPRPRLRPAPVPRTRPRPRLCPRLCLCPRAFPGKSPCQNTRKTRPSGRVFFAVCARTSPIFCLFFRYIT